MKKFIKVIALCLLISACASRTKETGQIENDKKQVEEKKTSVQENFHWLNRPMGRHDL